MGAKRHARRKRRVAALTLTAVATLAQIATAVLPLWRH